MNPQDFETQLKAAEANVENEIKNNLSRASVISRHPMRLQVWAPHYWKFFSGSTKKKARKLVNNLGWAFEEQDEQERDEARWYLKAK